MIKPIDLPEWASAGDIVVPPAGKRAVGWRGGERPPAQYLNWLANSQNQWIEWFSDSHDEWEWTLHASSASSTATPAANLIEWQGAGTTIFPIPVRVGDRLVNVRAFYACVGTSSVTPRLRRTHISTRVHTNVVAGTTDSTPGGTSVQLLTANHVIEASYSYYLELVVTGTGLVYDAAVKFDRNAT